MWLAGYLQSLSITEKERGYPMSAEDSERRCLEIIELSAANLDLLADTFDFIATIADSSLVLVKREVEEDEAHIH